MSEEVAARIRDAIRDHGPITFAEFMEHALYAPGGFYERPPIGREGHFVTGPHIHPIFAELLLRALADLWDGMGRPDPLFVVEVGAGDGTLARDLLRFADERDLPIEYAAVERSPGARERLAELRCRVAWSLEELGELDRAVVFANELLDNLPFRRVRATRTGVVEICVGVGAAGFVEVETDLNEEIAAVAPPLEPGREAIAPVGALAFLKEIAAAVRSGYILLIDYGSADDRAAGEVHGYRDHRVLEDVLSDPGGSDITAGVDFRILRGVAANRGLGWLGLVTQHDALLSLGLTDWDGLQRERQTRLMAEGAGSDAVRVWEGRSRASLLADPAGLGRLRWLLLATSGLPAPAWLRRAAATTTQLS